MFGRGFYDGLDEAIERNTKGVRNTIIGLLSVAVILGITTGTLIAYISCN